MKTICDVMEYNKKRIIEQEIIILGVVCYMKFIQENYFETIKKTCIQYLYSNYDYCYLKAMHEKNRLEGADTIIVGSSHSMNGIVESELKNGGDVISFCISSQDLYYDFMHIKTAIKDAKKPIKRCLINLGYYMLFQDLSRSENIKSIIPKTYMNLWGEKCVHNFVDAEQWDLFESIKIDSSFYPVEAIKELCDYWACNSMKEQSSYYGELMQRENNNILGVKQVVWNELNEDQKNDYALNRTQNGHNRHIKHTITRQENGEILSDMVELLSSNSIKTYFFITPYTNNYMNYIDKSYKPDILSELEKLQTPVEFLDMNELEGIFCNEDFIDSDHLNKQGAIKATALLDEFIAMAEE